MDKVNWGVIGLGNISQKFLDGFSEVQNARILGLSSKSLKKLEKFSDMYKIEKKFCFNSYEDLINCSEIDIIYIALPNSLHYEWIIKCLDKDKKILVEKPVTTNFYQLEEIEKKNINKIFFAEAFMYRFSPHIKFIIDLIKNDEIGDLIRLDSSFGVNLLTKKKFFFFKKKKKIDINRREFNPNLGGGCILDLGCYPVSFCVLLSKIINDNIEFDNSTNIYLKNIKKEYFQTGVDIDSHLELKIENLLTSKIKASFKNNYGNSSLITGKKGSIFIDDTWLGGKKITIIKDKKKIVNTITFKKNIYSYEIENISKTILEKKNYVDFPAMTFLESKLNMKILDKWINAK